MIGNDIIDINYTRLTTDWTRRGFLEKVFTNSEQELIASAKCVFTTVWQLWSIKESAYKVHFRDAENRRLNPSRIHCTLIDPYLATAKIDNTIYFSTTNITDQYIYTFASLSDQVAPSQTILDLDTAEDNSQSQLCKDSIIQYLARQYDWKVSDITIRYNRVGAPIIYHQQKRQSIQLSMTHHGAYGAWVVL